MSVLAIALLAAVATAAPAEDHYASRYDHLDVESILNNRRMVNYYAACLLSKGPCPPQGLELKRILPEALQTNCGKCTEKQKTVAYRTIKRLKKEYPKIWEQLEAIWDPERIYVSKFEASFESQKPTAAVTPQVIINRFGDDEPAADNAVSSPSSPTPSTSTVTTSTTTTTTTTTTSTKPTNRPVSSFTFKPQQAPPYTTVGANLQATVTFMAALKNIVLQLYQLKLETLNRILSGR